MKYIEQLGVKKIAFAPQRVDSPLLVQGKALKSISDPVVKVAIVSAIARPHRFIDSLKIFGIEVNEKYFLPDHWTFDREKIRNLSAKNDAIVTTAKDFWRDQSVFEDLNVPVYVLPIHFDIDSQTMNDIEELLN